MMTGVSFLVEPPYKRLGTMLLFQSQYLSLGDIHKHGKAGHVIALAADVGVVSGDEVTTFR